MLENIKLAFEALRANKMRAFLTMLGIIIGIASVIAIVSVGSSMTASVNEQLRSSGIQNIYISVRQSSSRGNSASQSMDRLMGGESRNSSDSDLISLDDISNMMEEFSNELTAYSVSSQVGSGQIKSGSTYANVTVTGVSPGYENISSVTLLTGRFINDTDMDKSRSVAVISNKAAERMFSSTDNAYGQKVRVYLENKIVSYTVIGVYEYDDSSSFGQTSSDEDLQTDLYIPVTTAKKQSGGNKNYSSITVEANENSDVTAVTTQLSTYWTNQYKNNETWTTSVSNMASMVESATETLSTVSTAIAAIAGISLLVGGIGVMNIMLVSVTERTHEIGIRKALGAENSQIKMQFIIEAGTISLIGGIVGVALGIGLGLIACKLMSTAFTISPVVIIVSVVFSTAIGLFFGAYPASKAAKLDPIEALRYE